MASKKASAQRRHRSVRSGVKCNIISDESSQGRGELFISCRREVSNEKPHHSNATILTSGRASFFSCA